MRNSASDTDNQGSRTIGLLVSLLEAEYQGVVWKSCAEVVHNAGMNLAVFVGGTLDAAPGVSDPVNNLDSTSLLYDTEGTFIYTVPTIQNCDGLLIITSSLGTFSSLNAMTEFCYQYAPLPVVSYGLPIPGVSSVICDSRTGIRDAVAHQIREHGHRKIAFIRGPEHHSEAEERFTSYRETLQVHGIPFDPTLTAPGDYISINQAKPIIQRWLRQGVQSIIVANDTMALDAIRYLQSLGIKVPHDIAVIGFDDQQSSSEILPPLTTVRQPLVDMTRRAVDILIALVNGDPQPELTQLPSELIVRQSCGCSARLKYEGEINDPVSYLTQLSNLGDSKNTQMWAEQLMHIYNAALTGTMASETEYHAAVESLTYDLARTNIDLTGWLEALIHLRHHLRTQFEGGKDEWLRVERLWDIIVGSISQVGIRRYGWKVHSFEHDDDFRNFVGEEILATYDAQHLEQVLRQYAKHLGVPNSYIATFPENHKSPVITEHAQIVINTSRQTRTKSEGITFQPAHELLPGSILQNSAPWHVVVEPLYSQTHKLGYAVFEVGDAPGTLYTSLRSELSSAVMSMQLVQQLTDAYIEVEERIVKRTAEMVEQINQRARVETAREAIYEISEAARSSQDIQQLYPEIHRIVARLLPAENFYIAEVDDESQMISFPYFVDEHDTQPDPRPMDSPTVTSLVIQRQEPLLIDPDTFDNLVDEGVSALIGSPSLDWLGVPLTLGDHTFGALVVQTYSANLRYTQEDLNLLSFVSAQIALAINRVRTDAERNRLMRALQQRARQLETASEITRLTSALRDVQDVLNDAVTLIQDRFEFYFIGIYLVEGDPARAVLRAASGDTGKLLLSSSHSLTIDGPSMIGRCTASGVSRLAADVNKESYRYANPWLPETRSELALPLLTGNICIGAVTVQSTELDAFEEDDINLLQALMDHIAIAIENAALHERIQTYTNELEAQVEARTAALQATNAELSTFAYSVSHDLRAPLRRIDGFSEAVIQDYADDLPNMAKDYLRRVRQSAQQMNALIEALLELSRVTQAELYRSDVDMSALANDIMTGLKQNSPKHHVDTIVMKELHVNADPRLLRIVLDNLLGNAWKFTCDTEQARIEVGSLQNDARTTYYVRDNGVGFNPQYADKLFAPFQRLHDVADFEGTGIGLATVQRIIRRHGGMIWAESEEGHGATFYFTLG